MVSLSLYQTMPSIIGMASYSELRLESRLTIFQTGVCSDAMSNLDISYSKERTNVRAPNW